MQELYSAVPVALAPILGNPILLAAFGVDRSAPLQDQVQPPVLHMSIKAPSALISAGRRQNMRLTTHVLMLCHFIPQAVAFGQGVAALLPQLAALTEILPAPTLAWKLKLLQEGNRCAALLPLCNPPPLPVPEHFSTGKPADAHRCLLNAGSHVARGAMGIVHCHRGA